MHVYTVELSPFRKMGIEIRKYYRDEIPFIYHAMPEKRHCVVTAGEPWGYCPGHSGKVFHESKEEAEAYLREKLAKFRMPGPQHPAYWSKFCPPNVNLNDEAEVNRYLSSYLLTVAEKYKKDHSDEFAALVDERGDMKYEDIVAWALKEAARITRKSR